MRNARDRAGARALLIALACLAAVAALLCAAGVFVGPLLSPAASVASVPQAVAATATAPTTDAVKPSELDTDVAEPPHDGPSAEPILAAPSGSIVCIDPGHQGRANNSLEPIGPGATERKPKVSSGAAGVATRTHESVINLKVAKKLRSELQARGVKVVMVRESENVDIPNSKRAQIANDANSDLFIRLHCDGSNNHASRGLSTLVPARNEWTAPIVAASKSAGKAIHQAVLAASGAVDRGVVTRSDLSGFNWSAVPTVLVEMGFMSNASEDRALSTEAYQEKLARGLANGIVEYLRAQ